MGPAVYILSSMTFATCAILLLRGYWRMKQRLLLWSSLCFFGLAISNLLLFLDLVVLPQVDLYVWRLATAAVATLLLLYGLIWEGE
ncbi:DUF5985 family protein [Edaphobacter paludis]|uniref:DUF5985 family protein n=1 Tax=Edaphobacter paludis TaxID=3035702 RepID=A0AAU7D8G8_9BACT